MAANRIQIQVRNLHRQVATNLGFGQSTVKHRTLQGTISAPSPTGNRVYTPPGPRTADETTTDTLVWVIWMQKVPKTTAQDDIQPGRTVYENWLGQMPYVDDNGNVVAVADEDWLEDNQSPANRYRIQNLKIDASLSFWQFEMERLQ